MVGLYIHVPFCQQRCVYCDFYFVTGKQDHSAFVEALCIEMRHVAKAYPSQTLSTVYIGGGTPSQLSCYDLATILESIHQTFDTSRLHETTIELNPEDTDALYLQELRELGLNRISLGIQSFFDDELEFMNRSHDASTSKRALELVAEADFSSYSVDLIFGLPGQTPARWTSNLKQLVNYAPPHISTYSLTVEPKTPLYKNVERGLINPAPDGEVATMYQLAMDILRTSGLEHYEISSFSKAGHRAQHNQQYWTHSNYLGLGPSAHSFWWDKPSPAERWENIRNLPQYTSRINSGKPITVFREMLDQRALGKERIMLAIRTAEGVDTEALWQDYGLDLMTENRPVIESLTASGHAVYEKGFFRLTDRGKHLCDRITLHLLSAS